MALKTIGMLAVAAAAAATASAAGIPNGPSLTMPTITTRATTEGSLATSNPASKTTMSSPPLGTSPYASCGTSRVNAPRANLIYWDPVVHDWALSSAWCITFTPTQAMTTVQHYQAAATITVQSRIHIPSGTETDTITMTESGSITTTTNTLTWTGHIDPSDYQIANFTATVSLNSQRHVTVSGGTPVVVISELEVESLEEADDQCIARTSTTSLSSPLLLSMPGTANPWPGSETAWGSLPPHILDSIMTGNGPVVAGTYNGLPTIAIASLSTYIHNCDPSWPMRHLTPASPVGALVTSPPPVDNIAPTISRAAAISSEDPTPAASPANAASITGPPGGNMPTALAPDPTGAATVGRTLSFEGQTFTADSTGGFDIHGQKLAPGSSVVLGGGTTLELSSTPTAVVVKDQQHTSTIPIAYNAITQGGPNVVGSTFGGPDDSSNNASMMPSDGAASSMASNNEGPAPQAPTAAGGSLASTQGVNGGQGATYSSTNAAATGVVAFGAPVPLVAAVAWLMI